jgi:hydrogenase nickel incorporation protein HypA/HybF
MHELTLATRLLDRALAAVADASDADPRADSGSAGRDADRPSGDDGHGVGGDDHARAGSDPDGSPEVRVEELVVELGALTHVAPEQLRFCLGVVAEDTPAEGAAVTVERLPPRAECACGWAGEPDHLDDLAVAVPDPVCPACGDRLDPMGGRECRLARVRFDDGRDGEQPDGPDAGSTDGRTTRP